jgi:hypothetical protein
MDPIDAKVGKEEEERELEVVVLREWGGRGRIVEFGVAAHFSEEERGGQDGHDGHGEHGLSHLQPNLVLEKFRVRESCVVEYEEVGRGCEDEIDDEAEDPMFLLANAAAYGQNMGTLTR